jgi:hypothetical protein
MVLERLPAKSVLSELVPLHHRTHGAVEQDDALREQFLERFFCA